MKKVLLLIVILISVRAFSQDTTRVEQYCQLVAQGRLFSNKVTIDVDFGEQRKFFSGDTRMRDEVTGKIKKFNSVTDALNYMGAEGWTLVNAFPINTNSGPQVYHFYFKKLFNKEDVLKAEK
jgi:hypothetical protein